MPAAVLARAREAMGHERAALAGLTEDAERARAEAERGRSSRTAISPTVSFGPSSARTLRSSPWSGTKISTRPESTMNIPSAESPSEKSSSPAA